MSNSPDAINVKTTKITDPHQIGEIAKEHFAQDNQIKSEKIPDQNDKDPQHQKTLAKQPQNSEEAKKEKVAEKGGEQKSWLEIITAVIAMFTGASLDKKEEQEVSKDLASKYAGKETPKLAANDVKDTVRNVTGDKYNDIANMPKDALETAKHAAAQILNIGKDNSEKSAPLFVAKQQEAVAGGRAT